MNAEDNMYICISVSLCVSAVYVNFSSPPNLTRVSFIGADEIREGTVSGWTN